MASDVEQADEPVWRRGHPRGAKPKATEDVRVVEVTLTVATTGQYDRHGNRRADVEAKTDAEVLAMVVRYLRADQDGWPKWLKTVEVDAIYDPGDDEE